MNVELPKDADGREIPLDTKRLYDAGGVPVSIRAFRYNPNERLWRVERLDGVGNTRTTALRFTPTESWEKLEEDLDRVVENKDAFYSTACAYMNQGGATCDDCRFRHNTSSCTDEMFKDVVSRIRKLRGED